MLWLLLFKRKKETLFVIGTPTYKMLKSAFSPPSPGNQTPSISTAAHC